MNNQHTMTQEEFDSEFPPEHPSKLIYQPAEDVIPSYELIHYWEEFYAGHNPEWAIRHIATCAAEWAADRELEKCAIYLDSSPANKIAEELIVARRALKALPND